MIEVNLEIHVKDTSYLSEHWNKFWNVFQNSFRFETIQTDLIWNEFSISLSLLLEWRAGAPPSLSPFASLFLSLPFFISFSLFLSLSLSPFFLSFSLTSCECHMILVWNTLLKMVLIYIPTFLPPSFGACLYQFLLFLFVFLLFPLPSSFSSSLSLLGNEKILFLKAKLF